MQKADHSGHRARMKKKFIERGASYFEPHEILEMLLFYAIPQRNTNDIAKNLIDHFGSLSAVFDASIEALNDVGVTEHQAVLLKLIPEITRRYLDDKRENYDKSVNPDYIPAYFADMFIGREKTESAMLILLNKKGNMVYSGMVFQGDFNYVHIPVRDIISLAIKYSASIAYLAHNHPSGIATPSREDIKATRKLKDALDKIGVYLVDHIIFGEDDYVSLNEVGLMTENKDDEVGLL